MAENAKKKVEPQGAPARKRPTTRKQRRARTAAARPVAGPHASLSFLRVAPRKVRLVAGPIRGMRVGDALAVLKYTPQRAAPHLAKLLRSAVANAEGKGGRVDVDALFVKTLTVDQGPKQRRYMPRAMGRATRIDKKTSHVYVELAVAERA
jgi:large subunit ribosomal protein L22